MQNLPPNSKTHLAFFTFFTFFALFGTSCPGKALWRRRVAFFTFFTFFTFFALFALFALFAYLLNLRHPRRSFPPPNCRLQTQICGAIFAIFGTSCPGKAPWRSRVATFAFFTIASSIALGLSLNLSVGAALRTRQPPFVLLGLTQSLSPTPR